MTTAFDKDSEAYALLTPDERAEVWPKVEEAFAKHLQGSAGWMTAEERDGLWNSVWQAAMEPVRQKAAEKKSHMSLLEHGPKLVNAGMVDVNDREIFYIHARRHGPEKAALRMIADLLHNAMPRNNEWSNEIKRRLFSAHATARRVAEIFAAPRE